MKPSKRPVPTGEDGKALTELERDFIEAYLKTFDLYLTMKAIGKADRGHRINIEQRARLILTRPPVLKEVEERFKQNLMTGNEVLYRLTLQARGVYANYFVTDEKGTRFDFDKMVEDGYGHLVKLLRPGRFGTTFEFMDTQKALELVGRHHKLFTDKIDTSGEVVIRVVYDDVDTVDPDS